MIEILLFLQLIMLLALFGKLQRWEETDKLKKTQRRVLFSFLDNLIVETRLRSANLTAEQQEEIRNQIHIAEQNNQIV